MSDFIGSEDTSTCCFLVGQAKVKVRGNIFLLSTSSTVFEAMLCGKLQEKHDIEVPDIELDAFITMLKYINGKEVRFTNMDHASRVCYAADKYDLPDLKRQCAEYMFPCSIDDVWLALNCGVMYNIDLLKDAAMQFVRQNTYKVLKSNQFKTLTLPSLKIIVQDDCLNIKSEVELLDAVMDWAKHQCYNLGKSYEFENIRDVLGDVINHIRFLTMSKAEIIKNCKTILATDEKQMVLKCLSKDSDIQFMDSLCCSTVRRGKNATTLPINDVHTVIFKKDHVKHIVASNDIKSLTLIPEEDKEIILYSVTVSTRSSLVHEVRDRMYFEDIVLELRDKNGKVVACGNFAGRVEYDSELRIPLFTPEGNFPIISHPLISSEGTKLHISFKSKETHYYSFRKWDYIPDFPNIRNTFSYVIGVEYSSRDASYTPNESYEASSEDDD